MKKYILIMLFVIFYFTAITVHADEQKDGVCIGFKGGMFSIDKVNSLNIFSLGGTVGYTFPFKIGYFRMGLEGDFNLGYFGGDRVSGYPGDKSSMRAFGAYGVISTIPSNDIYTKAKIGVTRETVIERRSDVEKLYRETGPSFGIGAGFKASNNINMEAEFTTTHSDMKFFSIGLKFLF
jgi:hypothetical protein